MESPRSTASSDAGDSPRAPGWEHFAHGADIALRGWGASPERAFEQAALALTRVVTEADIQPLRKVEVACEAPDLELLLVEWLNAVIFEMAVRRMLFGRFAVRIKGRTRLHARLWGEPVDAGRHDPAVEPKGATCTALRVAQEADGGWSAACVVDI